MAHNLRVVLVDNLSGHFRNPSLSRGLQRGGGVFGRLYTMSDNRWQLVFSRGVLTLTILPGIASLSPGYGSLAVMIAAKTECRPPDPTGRVAAFIRHRGMVRAGYAPHSASAKPFCRQAS